jgi:ubiquinone biosynthesis protein Coq4
LLLDDSHIPGMTILQIQTSYDLSSSWMMGEDAEQFMAPIWEKSREVWEKDLREGRLG